MPHKPAPQIEIWRTEVSYYTVTPKLTSSNNSSSSSTSPTPSNLNSNSIWKKILHRSSSSTSSTPPFTPDSIPSKIHRKLKLKLRIRGNEKEVEGIRTKMYEDTLRPTQKDSQNGEAERRRMDAGVESQIFNSDVDVDVESEDNLLKQKRERLERAARLLNGSGAEEVEGKVVRPGDG